MKIQFGTKVKDKITGFEGVTTGYTNYITGCAQYLVQPPVDKDGKHVDARWIDQDRLSVVPGCNVITLEEQKHPGADMPAPIR